MEFDRPKTAEGFEILTPSEFNERLGINVSTNTITYNFDNGTLDYCGIGRFKLVVWNDKAKNFKLSPRGRKKQ